MVQSRLYSCTFIYYLLIIDFKKKHWSPGGQPYCVFSVTLCNFQLPGVIGRLLSLNPDFTTLRKLRDMFRYSVFLVLH